MTTVALYECWVARPGLRAWMPRHGWSTTLTWNTHTPLSVAKLLIFLIAKHLDTNMQVLLVIIVIILTWQLEIFVTFQVIGPFGYQKPQYTNTYISICFCLVYWCPHGPVLTRGQIQSGFQRGATRIPKGFKGTLIWQSTTRS